MSRTRGRRAAARAIGLAALVCAGTAAAPALAHTGGANCTETLKQEGTTYVSTCTFPFQGFPVGVDAVFRANPDDPSAKPAEIHPEILLKPAFGTPQSLSMECYDPEPNADGSIPVIYGTARCKREWNDPAAGQQFTLVSPIPTAIVGLQCTVHSHARYSRAYPPSGESACWSSNEARQDLEADGVMARIDG